MGRRKLKLAWISQNANRRATFRKRQASLLEKVRQLSVLCGVKACAIIYDPDKPKDQKPETWPSEEETKAILGMDREEYLRQRVAKLEEQHDRIHRINMETILTIFLHNCMVEDKSLDDLRTVDEAECLMRVIDKKMKAVKGRIEKIRKGKMVNADMAEDGKERDSELKNLSNFEVDGSHDDLFCCGYSNNGDVGESLSWMETMMMMGADYNTFNGNDDGFFQGFVSNGEGGLEKVIRRSGFNVGESSSLMGPSSAFFLG